MELPTGKGSPSTCRTRTCTAPLHFQEWLRQSPENPADMPSSKVPARPSIREPHSSIKDSGAGPTQGSNVSTQAVRRENRELSYQKSE